MGFCGERPHHYQDEDMTEPYKWKIGFADAYANNYGTIVDEYLTWVVQPSLAALEERRQELAADEDVVSAFALSDHEQLIKKAHMAFALAIQSLYEQQLRSYLTTCASGFTIEGVTQTKLEKGAWGDVLNGVFFRVRGIKLDTFDSYTTLTQLQMLGNACRHGEGDSSRNLHKHHPELWPEPQLFPWDDGQSVLPPPPVQHLQITLDLLTRYVSAIALFWLDMESHGVKSLVDAQPGLHVQIALLQERRIPLLAIVTR
jgi:hypothetical protein